MKKKFKISYNTNEFFTICINQMLKKFNITYDEVVKNLQEVPFYYLYSFSSKAEEDKYKDWFIDYCKKYIIEFHTNKSFNKKEVEYINRRIEKLYIEFISNYGLIIRS